MTDGSPMASYLAGLKDAAGRHRERAFEYEKEAIEYTRDGFKSLTYLNGGGLLALPTAVAFFKTDPLNAKTLLVCAGISFIAGLLLVVAAQSAAFFTMGRRSESEIMREYAEQTGLSAYHFPDTARPIETVRAEVSKLQIDALIKMKRSDVYRRFGILMFWASVVAFVAGGACGAIALLA